MGVIIPVYTRTVFVNGGPPQQLTYNDVYVSLRQETTVLQHNPDGTYNMHGLYRIYQDRNQLFCIDRTPFNLSLTADKLTLTNHGMFYSYIKSQYPGAYDCI